ncbi:hypothetical protein [Dactylosporangium sp. CA-139066]|uniref:hypothetical protein n=1 Tax=Dactylosporangium sp. CA-139066 TaxID=3239930 RepID=UPI003D92D4F2
MGAKEAEERNCSPGAVTSMFASKVVEVYGGPSVFGATAEQPGGARMADNDPAADPSVIDLDAVQSVAAFAAACSRLREGRSYAVLERAARPLSLPKATLSDLLNAKSIPTRETVIAFLTACGLLDEAQRPWLAAWERVATAHQPRPDGAVRVRDARPRLLGVHAAIQVEGAHGELPPYVPRDLDADLRTAITAAAASGGLVLMVGGSSVGKTRALFEAVQAALPEWWLLHPADIPTIGAHAAAPTPRTVLWLDELQRYLNHPAGLTFGTLHGLIAAGTVVVATLWPEEFSRRAARPAADQPDPHADDREILRLAHVIRVPDRFTTAERRRGEALAGTDRRLRIALDTTDAGFTQVLAAGPALIQRWETAEDCYGQAVITAALDARRVGAQHPVTHDYLTAAAPAYLTPTQQATAPPDWLAQALAYATTPVHGAAACLAPVPAGMGRIAGWITADYLYQHAQNTRRTTALPSTVWQALVTYHHPDDTSSLADNAYRRDEPVHAITLYTAGAEPSDLSAAVRLLGLLKEHGHAADHVLQLLRTRAEAGNWLASEHLDALLAQQGHVEELRTRAGAGDSSAAHYLVELLAEQGRIDDALQLLRTRGDMPVVSGLVNLLVKQGRIDDALQLLRPRADAGEWLARGQLAALLAKQGHVEELRTRADAGDWPASGKLAALLAKQGHVEELRTRADAGDGAAASQLAALLAEQGRIDDALQLLRPHADAEDWLARRKLADLLAEQGHVEELRTRADAADWPASGKLAALLAKQGHVDELRTRADAGDGAAASQLAALLAKQGHVEELRTRADAGSGAAASQLAALLAEQREIAALRDEVCAGTAGAAEALRQLLDDQP